MQKNVALLFSLIVLFLSSQAQESQQAPETREVREPSRSHAILLRGPYLQVATPTSIMIRWRTDVLVKGIVRYGTTPDKLDKMATDSMQTTEHKVKLTGLEPRGKYYYSIGSKIDTLKKGPENYFVTLPTPGTTALYRIACVGDCGNNSVNQRNVRDQLLHYLGKNYLDAWLLMGDNTYTYGRDAEFQSNFFNIYKDSLLKNYPLYPSPGNHDYNDDRTAQDTHDIAYYQIFSVPVDGEAGGVPSHNPAYYSYDYGNIHFLSLDSYGRENNLRMYDTTSAQVEWIKKDLEANKDKQWIIAYWHHPPYTMGSHNSDHEDELVKIRENFIQILERYGVDLILCGHSHDYERSRLIKGHYGMETTFSPATHQLSNSSGMYDGSPNSCPYLKDSTTGYKGTVYVVSGSAGQLGGKQTSFPHDALPYSDATHGGAGMLEIEGNRLDWKWICADGEIRDRFTMLKNVNQRQVLTIEKGQSIMLAASFPSNQPYKWNGGITTTSRSVYITPTTSKTYTVKDASGCLQDIFEVKVK